MKSTIVNNFGLKMELYNEQMVVTMKCANGGTHDLGATISNWDADELIAEEESYCLTCGHCIHANYNVAPLSSCVKCHALELGVSDIAIGVIVTRQGKLITDIREVWVH